MSDIATTKKLTPDLLLRGYAAGIFPMSDSSDTQEYFWVNPRVRGILPLDRYHLSKNLKKIVRKELFRVTFNQKFNSVIDLCAEKTQHRSNTWINSPIRNSVQLLHEKGFAHSVECWSGQELVGGLYGISLGSAFFGESMFSRTTDASKFALVYLLAQLHIGKFQLLDTQFKTDHLAQFGVVEISLEDYLSKLERALKYQSHFNPTPAPELLKSAVSFILDNSCRII